MYSYFNQLRHWRQRSPQKATTRALFALLLAGCSTQQVTNSGFLRDYQSLEVIPVSSEDNGARASFRRPTAEALAQYQSVFIDPITVLATGLDQDQNKALSDALFVAVETEVKKSWSVVSAPEPRSLRIRVAITAVKKSIVPLNVLTLTVAMPLSNGGVAVEAEIVDVADGTQIAAVTWASERRMSQVLGYFAETGHARSLLPEFAPVLARLLNT
jgi:hypothetical protein